LISSPGVNDTEWPSAQAAPAVPSISAAAVVSFVKCVMVSSQSFLVVWRECTGENRLDAYL
jgi:hypothetical protein